MDRDVTRSTDHTPSATIAFARRRVYIARYRSHSLDIECTVLNTGRIHPPSSAPRSIPISLTHHRTTHLSMLIEPTRHRTHIARCRPHSPAMELNSLDIGRIYPPSRASRSIPISFTHHRVRLVRYRSHSPEFEPPLLDTDPIHSPSNAHRSIPATLTRHRPHSPSRFTSLRHPTLQPLFPWHMTTRYVLLTDAWRAYRSIDDTSTNRTNASNIEVGESPTHERSEIVHVAVTRDGETRRVKTERRRHQGQRAPLANVAPPPGSPYITTSAREAHLTKEPTWSRSLLPKNERCG